MVALNFRNLYGAFLTFSSLGVKLYPTTVANAFIVLGIMLLFSFIGLLAGYLCSLANKQKENQSAEENKNN